MQELKPIIEGLLYLLESTTKTAELHDWDTKKIAAELLDLLKKIEESEK